MGYDIRADYNQQYIFPRRLEDWVDEKHSTRFVRDFVDSLDLTKLGFREHKAIHGRPPYSTELKLKIWVYGYFKKIYSTRGLETATYENVGMIWLFGGETSGSQHVVELLGREQEGDKRGISFCNTCCEAFWSDWHGIACVRWDEDSSERVERQGFAARGFAARAIGDRFSDRRDHVDNRIEAEERGVGEYGFYGGARCVGDAIFCG